MKAGMRFPAFTSRFDVLPFTPSSKGPPSSRSCSCPKPGDFELLLSGSVLRLELPPNGGRRRPLFCGDPLGAKFLLTCIPKLREKGVESPTLRGGEALILSMKLPDPEGVRGVPVLPTALEKLTLRDCVGMVSTGVGGRLSALSGSSGILRWSNINSLLSPRPRESNLSRMPLYPEWMRPK
ncbi:hypothetical protein SCHPADRAFT_343341 [Schizopora paradoxa]|uniref:Uncharacterized protein n=1 Tax=Schizopora paradoxa TaxID=27342 RepID=A0A0H2RWL7_9AGAM|nr:hypothetical protein SCHPADRAFT_343341 [Schizopora paradoxa]